MGKTDSGVLCISRRGFVKGAVAVSASMLGLSILQACGRRQEYAITKTRPFSEDRAWVDLGGSKEHKAALIDRSGRALLTLPETPYYCSQMTDGLSFVLFSSSEKHRYIIVDSSGTVLSGNENGENDYWLLGYGGGHFIVAEHINNFNVDEWYLGTVDKNGEVANELKASPETKGDVRLLSHALNKELLTCWVKDDSDSDNDNKTKGERPLLS
jgi:hypothetical protein